MEENENYFKKLNKIAWEVEKKNNLSYISWATAWEMTKKEFPTATYEIYENEQGFPFWESSFGIDCKVWVTINDIEHIVRLPVMDWANKAMKAESYKYTTKYWEKTCEAATQFDINKATQRAFTKAMAMHWIWLYVYKGEDLPIIELTEEEWFIKNINESNRLDELLEIHNKIESSDMTTEQKESIKTILIARKANLTNK